MKFVFFQQKEAKNAGWLIGGKIAQMLLSLVVGILTARYLGPGNYGLISYGTAYVNFFMALCTLGINSVIIKDFFDDPNGQGRAIGTTIIMRIVSSFMSAVMIVGIVSIVDRDEPLTIAVVALCTISLMFQSFDTINYWFQAQYKSRITATVAFLAYLCTSVYRVILLIMGMNVLWFAFAMSIDYIVCGVLLLIAYKKHNGPQLEVSIAKGKSLLGRSYHYILASMMAAIYAQTDKFMLKQMIDETSVGYYSLATTLCSMWVFILAAIIDSMYPTILQLHKIDYNEFEKKNRQLYAIVFYMSTVVSVGFLVLGKYIILLLYGQAYLDAVMPLKIITWYTAFSYLGVARNAWIVCENKQKYLKYMYFGAAIINVLLNLTMIPLFGASGAALASLITQVFTSIVLPLSIRDMRRNAVLMVQAILLKGIK